jgi:hypothetical protein
MAIRFTITLILSLVLLAAPGRAFVSIIGQEATKPTLTFRETSVTWGGAPGASYFVNSRLMASDGTGLLDVETSFVSRKAFKLAEEQCLKSASRVVEDSPVLDKKGHKVGRRVLFVITGDGSGEDGGLCRTDNKEKGG